MNSAFGSKRKARKIQVDDDDHGGANQTQNHPETLNPRKFPQNTGADLADHEKLADASKLAISQPTTSQPGRKAFKKSSLRQSIAFDDQDENDDSNENKPSIGRSNSTLKKKKAASSRLSFGPGEIISGDAAEALEDDEAFTPKKSGLGRRAIESNALRKSLPISNREREGDDKERPTYSKDYLNELKSSTPTTPKDLQSLQAGIEDEGLDSSELEGAMIVDTDAPAYIPSEAEIREKKERRARLANEKDFISLSDDGGGDGSQLSLLLRKKKPESRLVREDEDLGEGFDEFVDDGRISLGKKQEREAKRRHRKEMADMIYQAEGSGDDESDDSEAERRAAYEAAQTRAGMDGLHKHDDGIENAASQVPSKITPLPVLSECLARLQSTMSSMELEMNKRHQKLEGLEKDKREVLVREKEVQELLKQAGNRYAALKADSNGAVADPQNIVEAHTRGLPERMVVDRGLESFGNTPITRHEVEDVG
jgi:hypothetical protein